MDDTKLKITLQLDRGELENLCCILQGYVSDHRFTKQLDNNYSQPEKDWFKEHANYVEKEILQKIIDGVER